MKTPRSVKAPVNIACSALTFAAKGKVKCPHCKTLSEVELKVAVQATVAEEDGQYVSHCPELDIASCGKTVEEAIAGLKEALLVYLEVLEETGQRERVFREKGIRLGVESEPRGKLAYDKNITQTPVCV